MSKDYIVVKDIVNNNGTYTILYYHNDDPSTIKKLVGTLSAYNLDSECLKRIELSPDNINDTVSIEGSPDEYLILIPKSFQPAQDDLSIPLGLVRYYIMYHMDAEELFSFDIIESEEENINVEDVQTAILEYIGWR